MIRVEGALLTAVMNPRRGAKITSLVDAAGVEWLAQNTSPAAAPGTAFIDAEMCGWDECAPTIVACRVGDRDLPDHGDLWDAEFDIIDGSHLSIVASSLPYRFERRISATSSGLRLDYSAETVADPMPFLWAAHPQFAALPGTRVELPSGVDTVVDVLDATTPELPWAADLGAIDTLNAGECRKVYVSAETPVGAASLVRQDGSRLNMRWSDACPYLGIWLDRGAYSTVPVIALEPTTAYYDSLALAVRLGRAPILRPGQPLMWWVELEAVPAP